MKCMKYFGLNVAKYVHELFIENYKRLNDEILLVFFPKWALESG